MRVLFARPHAEEVPSEDGVALTTLRYRTAYAEYQDVVGRNIELMLSGGKPSKLAHLEEERAFDELDVARDALLKAAQLAYPTIH
jgi:hypothetical protein